MSGLAKGDRFPTAPDSESKEDFAEGRRLTDNQKKKLRQKLGKKKRAFQASLASYQKGHYILSWLPLVAWCMLLSSAKS